MNEYIRLSKFLKPHLWVLTLACISMVLSSVFGGASLGAIVPFVDKIISGKEIQISSNTKIPHFIVNILQNINQLPKGKLLNMLLLWVIIVFLLKEFFLFCQGFLMGDVSQRVIRDIKDKIYNKLLTLSLDFYGNNPTGKLVSRITFDTAIIRDSISEGLTDIIYQPIQLMVYVAILIFVKIYFSISWLLVFLSIFLLPSIVYPIIKIGKRLRKISRETQEKMAEINTTLYETISGINIVKAFCMEEYEAKRFQLKNRQFYRMTMKSVFRMLVINPLTEFTGIACTAIVIWFGGKEVVEGRLSPGAFVVFMAALLSLFKPFKRLSKVYAINQQALAAACRIFEVLDTKPTVVESQNPVSIPRFQSDICIEDVWFRYGKDYVLKDISLTIRRGEIVAIVGPSGSGKTTMVNLMPRFYDPVKGLIKIDGVNIKDISLRSLREQIGIVTQDTVLFDDTILANIAYGYSINTVAKERIIMAAEAANAHGFISRLSNGYDSITGERGFRLSGGEKQRLAIARAIFKDPPILILDEATSQLDTESEMLVQEAIDRLMKNRTVLVIAHRLSTIKHADRIIVLDKGEIVETGHHSELMSKAGLYKKLYDMQFRA